MSREDLMAARVLDILVEGPVTGGGLPWESAPIRLCHRVFGPDVQITTRSDGTEAGNAAYDRYQLVVRALHLLESYEMVTLKRDPGDLRQYHWIGLVE